MLLPHDLRRLAAELLLPSGQREASKRPGLRNKKGRGDVQKAREAGREDEGIHGCVPSLETTPAATLVLKLVIPLIELSLRNNTVMVKVESIKLCQ